MGSCLEFREQPYIFDGDYRLIRKGLKKRNLVVSEAAGLAAADPERTQRLVMMDQRHRDEAAVPADTSGDATGLGQSAIRLNIGDIDGRSITNGAGVCPRVVERPWIGRLRSVNKRGVDACEGSQLDLIAFYTRQHA